MRKFIVALAVGLAAVSCQNESTYSSELEQLDSLQAVVESYRSKLDSLDLQEIEKTTSQVNEQYSYLAENHPDSTSRDFWVGEMANFGLIRKNFSRFEENYSNLKEDIAYTTVQLQTLENSLRDETLGEGEKLAPEKADEYLQQEAQAVAQIRFLYTKVIPETKRAMVLYDSLGTRYDSIENYVRNYR